MTTARRTIQFDYHRITCRLRAMQGRGTGGSGIRVIQGIDAAQMNRKGQVLGSGDLTCTAKAWILAALRGFE